MTVQIKNLGANQTHDKLTAWYISWLGGGAYQETKLCFSLQIKESGSWWSLPYSLFFPSLFLTLLFCLSFWRTRVLFKGGKKNIQDLLGEEILQTKKKLKQSQAKRALQSLWITLRQTFIKVLKAPLACEKSNISQNNWLEVKRYFIFLHFFPSKWTDDFKAIEFHKAA